MADAGKVDGHARGRIDGRRSRTHGAEYGFGF